MVQSLFDLERWGLSFELFQSVIGHNFPDSLFYFLFFWDFMVGLDLVLLWQFFWLPLQWTVMLIVDGDDLCCVEQKYTYCVYCGYTRKDKTHTHTHNYFASRNRLFRNLCTNNHSTKMQANQSLSHPNSSLAILPSWWTYIRFGCACLKWKGEPSKQGFSLSSYQFFFCCLTFELHG